MQPKHNHTRTVHYSGKHQKHQSGHDRQHMVTDFRKRFWITTLLTIPALLLSPMIQNLL